MPRDLGIAERQRETGSADFALGTTRRLDKLKDCPQPFLGGLLSAEALLPWVDVDAVVDGTASRVRGFGDPTISAGVNILWQGVAVLESA